MKQWHDKLKLGRLHNRHVSRFIALENPANIYAHLTVCVRTAIAHETPAIGNSRVVRSTSWQQKHQEKSKV